MAARGPQYLLTLGFLTVIGAVGPLQALHEVREGESPQVLDLFRRTPNAANLRAFEQDLEKQSVVAQAIRPRLQYGLFRTLQDTGEQAVLGKEDWWFYRPDMRYLIERYADEPASQAGPQAAVQAIAAFRDQLADRGIQLLVVPVPGKPSVYPEMITGRAEACDGRVRNHTREVLDRLAEAGIETIDLIDAFAKARAAEGGSVQAEALYLRADTHWTNAGARLAAEAVAHRVQEAGWVPPGTTQYDVEVVTVHRAGDVLRMLKCPPIEELFKPQVVVCQRVIDRENGQPYQDDPSSPVLVLGDSFLRIYERDEPGSAGFIAHLARALGRPLASIVNDGGASTLVRQELARKSELLDGKKLVIWEFVERDIRFGMEGWQQVAIAND